MVTKYQVVVREVYEQEETEAQFEHIKTREIIGTYDFGKLSDEEKADYVRQEIPTGKMEIKENDTPIYGQTFERSELKVSDLVLYLNRVK